MRTGSAMSVSRSSQAPSSAACSLLLTPSSPWQGIAPSLRLRRRLKGTALLPTPRLRQAAASANRSLTCILTRRELTGTFMGVVPRPHRSCRTTSQSGRRLTPSLTLPSRTPLCSTMLAATRLLSPPASWTRTSPLFRTHRRG